jgi:copper(I)-binding protein
MHQRRTLALAVGALLLATPVLSSCGFNYATDRINTTQHGATNRDKAVDVLAAVIIAEQPGSGTLSARLVNNDSEPTELASIEGSEISVSDIEATEIVAGGAVAVADLGEGIRIDGDFTAGEVVPLTMTFANGDQVSLDVPVIRACGVYAEVEQAPAVGDGEASEAEAYSCETEAEGGH